MQFSWSTTNGSKLKYWKKLTTAANRPGGRVTARRGWLLSGRRTKHVLRWEGLRELVGLPGPRRRTRIQPGAGSQSRPGAGPSTGNNTSRGAHCFDRIQKTCLEHGRPNCERLRVFRWYWEQRSWAHGPSREIGIEPMICATVDSALTICRTNQGRQQTLLSPSPCPAPRPIVIGLLATARCADRPRQGTCVCR